MTSKSLSDVIAKMDDLQEKYGDANLYDDMWFDLHDWLMEQQEIEGRGNTQ